MNIPIITVNFNNSSGLKKTIRRVISQVYWDFESIVIDREVNGADIEVTDPP